MALITIVLEDTPIGGVSIHTNFKPAIGNPCTPAQSAALEIINRTKREWGLPPNHQPVKSAPQMRESLISGGTDL